jgi:hypothetical protein
LHIPIVQANTYTTECYFSQHTRLARQTMVLGAADVRALKRRIDGLAPPPPPPAKPVSTFVAPSALCLTAFVQAKGLGAGDDTHLLFQVDLCARLRPPVGARYVGNCVRGCIASADAGELLGAAGLLRAARAVQAAVAEAVVAPLAGVGKWVQRLMGAWGCPWRGSWSSPGARCSAFITWRTLGWGCRRDTVVLPVSMTGSPDMPMRDHGSSSPEKHGGKRDGEVHGCFISRTTSTDQNSRPHTTPLVSRGLFKCAKIAIIVIKITSYLNWEI